MSQTLFKCQGGYINLPNGDLVLVDRRDGGNLIVLPPREVWERSELTPEELTRWSFLVAATGQAMLEVLPQLAAGCVNYWEAGNWALNDQAQPAGRKRAKEFRRVHLHLLGRSQEATNPSWRWGEAPCFPDFVDRFAWASSNELLCDWECCAIVSRVELILRDRYEMPGAQIGGWSPCAQCGYPVPRDAAQDASVCGQCSVTEGEP